MPRQCSRNFLTALMLALTFLCAVSCAVNPVTGERQLMLLSDADEAKLGSQTDVQIEQQYGVYEDSRLNSYVDDLGQRMTRLSHRPNLQYRFKVLDSPVVNAFAVPGGYVYFTRGILAYLNSEAELAGVMGHELGHITARHSAQQYSRAQVAQIGLGLGMLLSETLQKFGGAAQFGVQMLFMRFSRDNERQADDLGVEYSSKAGYDATHMARFFETLERMNPGADKSGLPGWFSTHPNPEDRIGAVRRKSMEWQGKLGMKAPKVNRNAYLRRIDGLALGEDPAQGYVEKNTFYHPALMFQFPVPDKWQVQNTHTMLRMLSQRQDAVMMLGFSGEGSPRQAAQRFVTQNRASVIESGGRRVNGLPAYRVVGRLNTQQGQLGVMAYFIENRGKVYIFQGLSTWSAFSGYRSLFENSMRGFRRPAHPERLRRKPSRIAVRSVRKGGALRQVLKSMGAGEDDLHTLALLNGMQLDHHVQAGTLLKMVEKGG
jgi:predicted Zn-dependent protease